MNQTNGPHELYRTMQRGYGEANAEADRLIKREFGCNETASSDGDIFGFALLSLARRQQGRFPI